MDSENATAGIETLEKLMENTHKVIVQVIKERDEYKAECEYYRKRRKEMGLTEEEILDIARNIQFK